MDQLQSDDALLSKRQAWLGAIAGEGIISKIAAGAVMNTKDQLRGMVEAVTTGNTARVGPDVLQD